jgi:hypothetical protein
MKPVDQKDTANAREAELARLAKAALDASVENLDAATLSQLNQARQHALSQGPQTLRQRFWLPLGAAALASLAIVIALPLLTPQPALPLLDPASEDAYYSSQEDLELLEDLDLVLWLMEGEDHAS